MQRYLLLGIALLLWHASFSATVEAHERGTPAQKPLLVDIKCSKCHTLKRVFITLRPVEEWRDIVEEMMDKNPEWINPVEAEQILSEIVRIAPKRVEAISSEVMDYDNVRFLFLDRCTLCHTINRILLKDKTAEEWKETVERMRIQADGWITEDDAERIARFLSERAEVLREDAAGNIFVAKCLICHPGERILLETHDRAGWEKIVKDMQRIAKDTLPMARFGHEDAMLIIDLLAKTQGPESRSTSP